MIRLGTVVLGAEHVEPTVAFWVGALGYEPVTFPDSLNNFTILVPPDGEGVRVAVQQTTTPAQDHPRVHLDLVVDSATEQANERRRLLTLGASEVAWDLYPADADFVVLSDPAGNRFCIVDASHTASA